MSAAAVIVLALSGCAPMSATADATGKSPGMEGVTVISPAERRSAPAISGKDLDGRPQSLDAWRGKVVVLNVWGSWCGPCRGEADGLAQVARQSAGQGVQFLGIDIRDQSLREPLAFVHEHAIGYPNLYDPSGALLLSFPPDVLNPQAIPSTMVIDRHGRIAARALQPVTAQQLQTVLGPLVQEAS